MAIEITADDKETQSDAPEMEEVFILGEGPYEFYFPKVGALLSKLRRAGVESKDINEKGERYWELQIDWLERGFGEDVFAEIITDRLEDEDDELEEKHVSHLFKLLLKAASGRPTTSPNGSSRSRSAKKSKAARSRQVSDSETSTSESSAA